MLYQFLLLPEPFTNKIEAQQATAVWEDDPTRPISQCTLVGGGGRSTETPMHT